MGRWIRSQGFLLALLGAMGLAWLFPEWGASGGPLHSELILKIGIWLVFLLQGVNLPRQAILRGMGQWRLHLFVLAVNFVVTPFLAFIGLTVFGSYLQEEWGMGLFFLALLPTTISSAIAMTVKVGGDVPAATFASTLSNVVGIFTLPVGLVTLAGISLGPDSGMGSLLPLLGELGVLIALPMFIGQVVRPMVRGALPLIAKVSRPYISLVICFAVYTAFATTVQNEVWNTAGWRLTLSAIGGAIALLLALHGFSWMMAPMIGLHGPLRSAALFCGAHKTLAAGVPMATVVFAESAYADRIGLILIPILVYHPLQLLLAAVIAGQLKRSEDSPTA